jgi:transcriptional regulator with XRE-family HTH domain
LVPRLARALGPVLREHRTALGLSQEALAAILEIDRSTLAVLERALRGTTLAMFVLLAQGLQVSPPALLAEVMSRLEADKIGLGEGHRSQSG